MVETEGLEVVVRRHEPHPLTVRDLLTQGVEERAPDAPVSLHRRDERDLARAGLALIGQEADWSTVLLGYEAGEREDVDQLPATALERTSEFSIQQALGPHPVGVCVGTDHD